MRFGFRCNVFTAAGLLLLAAVAQTGCGTTRSTDTARTATEQLLISDAIDRAVQTVNLQSLAGQSVYLDDSRLGEVIDRNYLVSTLRQHLLASGCSLRTERDQADFIVEARAGAVGTDRNDLLFGIPSMNVPQILPMQPMPAAIPEVPFAKRRDQRGIAKIAVFAYHRETGTPVWQSGIAHQESSANDVWILGAGPFQRGTIYEGTAFAGKTLKSDDDEESDPLDHQPAIDLARETTFTDPQKLAGQVPAPPVDQAIAPAAHQEAAASPAQAQLVPPSAAPQPIAPAVSPGPPMHAANAGATPTTAAENASLRELFSAAAAQSETDSAVTARIYELPPARRTGILNVKPLIPKPVDPIPLPQPRFNSP